MVVTESNGGLTLEAESGDIWPAEADIVANNSGPGAAEQEEGINTAWERLGDVHLDNQLLKETNNREDLSPENHLEGSEPDPETDNTIFIAPLDGSQAELRSRVIKEVRKPGRSK